MTLFSKARCRKLWRERKSNNVLTRYKGRPPPTIYRVSHDLRETEREKNRDLDRFKRGNSQSVAEYRAKNKSNAFARGSDCFESTNTKSGSKGGDRAPRILNLRQAEKPIGFPSERDNRIANQ